MIQFDNLNIEIARPWVIALFFIGLAFIHSFRKRKKYRLRFNLFLQYKTLGSSSYFRVLYKVYNALLLIAFFLFVLQAMELKLYRTKQVKKENEYAVLFLIDASPSMSVQDIDGSSRWAAVKEAMSEFMERDMRLKIALALFSDTVTVIVPFTTDYAHIVYSLNQVKLGQLGDGTALSDAALFASDLLSLAQAEKRCLVFLSDGIQNSGNNSMGMAEQRLKKENLEVSIAHVGTNNRAEFSYTDPNDGKVYFGNIEPVTKNMFEPFSKAIQAHYEKIETRAKLKNFLSNLYYRIISKGESTLVLEQEDISNLIFLLALVLLALAAVVKLLFLRII